MVTVSTSRASLRLESLSAEHMVELRPLLADPRVAVPANVPVPFDGRRAGLYLHTRRRLFEEGRGACFVALWDGLPCGEATLYDMCLRASRAEIGFWVGRPYWGLGLGAEIVSRAVEIGVLQFGLSCIDARCRQENRAALRVLSQLGFKQTGRLVPRRGGATETYRWSRYQ